MNIKLRFLKRALPDPPSLPKGIAIPGFLMQNRCKMPLDKQKQPPYTPSTKKEVLIKRGDNIFCCFFLHWGCGI